MDGGGEAVSIYVSITAGRRLAAPHPLKEEGRRPVLATEAMEEWECLLRICRWAVGNLAEGTPNYVGWTVGSVANTTSYYL